MVAQMFIDGWAGVGAQLGLSGSATAMLFSFLFSIGISIALVIYFNEKVEEHTAFGIITFYGIMGFFAFIGMLDWIIYVICFITGIILMWSYNKRGGL
jgi:hypothetical protein